MSPSTPTPRTLTSLTLGRIEAAQLDALATAETVQRATSIALALDDAEQPYLARLLDLAAACCCGSGELAVPIHLGRDRLARARRRVQERGREAAESLLEQQRSALSHTEAGRGLLVARREVMA